MVKKAKKGHKGRIFKIIGLLMLMSAVALAVYNQLDEKRAESQIKEINEAVEKSIAPDKEKDAARLKLPDQMPTMVIDGKEYIGTLQVPSLELTLPILNHWSYENLRISPCRYDGDLYQCNLVIAAHNYVSHFGNLKYLKAGDEVIFKTADGYKWHYEVAEISTLERTDVEEMIDSPWDLTLFTCTYGGQSRVTVRCHLTGEDSILLTQPDIESEYE